jgi:hypothetical protein
MEREHPESMLASVPERGWTAVEREATTFPAVTSISEPE